MQLYFLMVKRAHRWLVYNLTPSEQECPEGRDLPPAIQMSTVARPFQSWTCVGMKIKEASFKMEFGSPTGELSQIYILFQPI